MKISELLEKYGDEDVQLQMLDSDMIEFDRKKDHNRFTFGTSMDFNIEGTTKLGIVIWLDRDKVKEITDGSK